MDRLKELLLACLVMPAVCVGIVLVLGLIWITQRTGLGRDCLTELGDVEY